MGADANFIVTIACLSLPESSGSIAQAKIALTRIENYLIGELCWCSGQMLRGS